MPRSSLCKSLLCFNLSISAAEARTTILFLNATKYLRCFERQVSKCTVFLLIRKPRDQEVSLHLDSFVNLSQKSQFLRGFKIHLLPILAEMLDKYYKIWVYLYWMYNSMSKLNLMYISWQLKFGGTYQNITVL